MQPLLRGVAAGRQCTELWVTVLEGLDGLSVISRTEQVLSS